MHYVTDTGPFCASCHSAAKAEYMPEVPGKYAESETPGQKHYGLVNAMLPPSPYLELSKDQKEAVINEAKLIDRNSSVTIEAPPRAGAGEEIEVTVKATGGNGPVICVMLVDRALRFQARPVSSSGWMIKGEPEVRGRDGKVQSDWLDRRGEGLARNLNFITVTGVEYDPDKKVFPSGQVTWTLRAPTEPGTYTLTAAFLYGTENSETAGYFQRPSGRILFSKEVKVRVTE